MIKKTILIAIMVLNCLSGFAIAPHSGYRGFADINCDMAFPKYWWGESRTDIYFGLSTTHGYQFNPHFFLGGGIMIERYKEGGDSYSYGELPYFAQARTDWTFGKANVYADLRFGGVVGGEYRLYLSPTVGYSFPIGKGSDMYLGVGMNFRGCSWGYDKGLHPQLALRLGVDFGEAVRQKESADASSGVYNPNYKLTPEWRKYRTLNALGWTCLGVGTTATLFCGFITALSAIEGGDVFVPTAVGMGIGGAMMLSSVPMLIVAHNYKNKAKHLTVNADAGFINVIAPSSCALANAPAVGISLDF